MKSCVSAENAPLLLDAPSGPAPRGLSSLLVRLSGGRVVPMTPVHDPVPRYGHGHPPHPRLAQLFEAGRDRYTQRLDSIAGFRGWFKRIPGDAPAAGSHTPFWRNHWLPPLDAAALYSFMATERPTRYVEIGSGLSTRFARQAVTDHDLPTEITSIDPCPRADVDAACDHVIRKRLEDAPLDVFDQLGPGDVLFVDSSHRALMNSDVTVVFLDILPRLQPGVIVHFHDVWLPYDYPDRWKHWYFNEQYLLAAVLLTAPSRFEILLPNMYISIRPGLSTTLTGLWRELGLADCPAHGGSLWMRLTERGAG